MPIKFLLSGFYFFYFAIIGIYVIFMPKVLQGLGFSGVDIGVVFATAPLVRFATPFAFIKGLKLTPKIFNFSLLLLVLSSALFFVAVRNLYALIFVNILLGMGLSLALPFVEVIALEIITKEHYGKVRLYGSIGFIIVALLLVRFLKGADIAISFLVVVCVLTAVFGYFIALGHTTGSTQNNQIQKSGFDIKKHRNLWIGLVLMQISFGPFYNFFTIYETAHKISLHMSVYLWSFGVIAEIVMLMFQGRLLRHNLLFIIKITVLSAVVRWLLLFLYPYSLAVSFFTQSLHALSFALFHTAVISYLFVLYKNKHLAQQFYLGMTYGLGGFIGALYSGYMYEYFSKYLFLSASVIAFAAFVFLSYHEKLSCHEKQGKLEA